MVLTSLLGLFRHFSHLGLGYLKQRYDSFDVISFHLVFKLNLYLLIIVLPQVLSSRTLALRSVQIKRNKNWISISDSFEHQESDLVCETTAHSVTATLFTSS